LECSIAEQFYTLFAMNGYRSAKTRRREHAAAVVCALALFVALVAGSALRPHFTTNALPEPGGWTHAVEHVQRDVAQVQHDCASGCLIASRAGGSIRPISTARKPFKYVWMTHDLPATSWTPLSLHSGWSALPISFSSRVFHARGTPLRGQAADSATGPASTLQRILRC
jgi:hypothetical protein